MPSLIDSSAGSSSQPHFRPAHIVLEGNICAGKSTLCALLKEELAGVVDVQVQSELTDDNFLTAFYQDMKKYGFAFQMFMFSTRLFQVEEGARLAKKNKAVVLTDRGVLGDWCFAKKNHLDGNLTDEEYAIYQDVATKRALCELPNKVDLSIYLDVDPEECCWRMRNLRKTEAEQGVLQEYMSGIDDCYFEGMLEMLHQGGRAMVLRWDKFGATDDVKSRLQAALDGHSKSASVQFVPEVEAEAEAAGVSDHVWIDTEAQIESTFQRIRSSTDQPEQTPSCVYVQYDMCYAGGCNGAAAPKSAGMTARTNHFKRVVMYYLSLDCKVVFYSPTGCCEDLEISALSPDSCYGDSPTSPQLSPSLASSATSSPTSPVRQTTLEYQEDQHNFK